MKKIIFFTVLALIVGLYGSNSLAEVGVTDTEIVVGTQMDLSGPAVAFAVMVKNGMVMKAKEINDAGGIHGRKIRLVVEDNAYNPAKAVMLANKMINRDRVFCFIGVFGTPSALATLPITNRKKIPNMFAVGLSKKFSVPFNRLSFQAWGHYEIQGRNLSEYIVKVMKHKKIGLLYQDDDFGSEVLAGMKIQLAKYGLKVAAAEPYKRGATEFNTQIAKLKKADVEVIVLATIIRETVGALKEINKLNWKVDVVSTSAAFSHYVPYLAEKSGFTSDGTYFLGSYPDPRASQSPFLKKWTDEYTVMFGKPPSSPSYVGWDYIEWFAIAAERAGRNLTREKLIKAFETFDNVPSRLGGPPITFTSESHLGSKRYAMFQLKKGVFTKISGWLDID